MIKIQYVYLFFVSILLNQDCISDWYTHIDKTNKSIYKMTFSVTLNTNNQINKFDSTILFIDILENKFRLEYNNQIQIFDNDKSLTLFIKTNQLYIENPDSTISRLSKLFFNLNELVDSQSNSQYIINNILGFNKIDLNFNSSCTDVAYVDLYKGDLTINIRDIVIEYLENSNEVSPFVLTGKYFKFDLRGK